MLSSLAWTSTAIAAYAVPAVAAAAVTVDLTARQTLTSFGAAGAWWPNDLNNFPVEKQAELADILFSPNGIWLSSYRYNLGSNGGSDTHDCYQPYRNIQSPALTNGTYDFSRDPAGRRFLEYASNHSVPSITFFLNSAPSFIASNQRSFGWDFTTNATEPFADYIATVLSHYTDQGIKIDFVSPMNEPDYLHPAGDQEGMTVAPEKRAYIFEAIKRKLSTTSAKNVKVIGDETSQVNQAENTWSQWLPNSTEVVGGLAIHNYDYPTDSDLQRLWTSIQGWTKGKTQPPVKFTEACCATSSGNGQAVFGSQYDPGMTNALVVGREVWQYLTILQAESFDWWTAVSELPCSPSVDGDQCYKSFNASSGFNDALVYIDGNYNNTKDYNLYTTKRTYLLKHLATFHRPGSVRYDVDHTNLPNGVVAIASKSPRPAQQTSSLGKDGFWNILFMNNATTPQTFQFQVPDKANILHQVIETTATDDFRLLPIIPNVLYFGTINVTLPAQSVRTMRFAKGR